MRQVNIRNLTHPLRQPLMAGLAVSFFQRLAGLMFQKAIPEHRGIVLVQPNETRFDAAIHMFFVASDLGIIWLDKQSRVIDTCLAKRWRPYYAPSRPALYVLETHPSRVLDFSCGDQVQFDHE
jgi:uncharacterized membrane protein (UPF0127 family)